MYKAEQWEAEHREWKEQFSLWKKPICLWKDLCLPFFKALLLLLLPFLLAPYHCFVVLSAEKNEEKQQLLLLLIALWKSREERKREKGRPLVLFIVFTRSVKRKKRKENASLDLQDLPIFLCLINSVLAFYSYNTSYSIIVPAWFKAEMTEDKITTCKAVELKMNIMLWKILKNCC